VVVALAVFLFLTLLIGPQILAAPVMLLAALFLGWVPSAARLWRAWHPGLPSVLLFFLATAAMVAGTHRFLKWLNTAIQGEREEVAARPWPWKRTLCGFGMLFCALVAICSLVLTVHQVYWMSTSPDPLFSDPTRDRMATVIAATDLKRNAEESQWDSVKTRAAFFRTKSLTRQVAVAEVFRPVWIEQDDHRLRAVILIPRHPLQRASASFALVQPGANLKTERLETLPQVLASFGIVDASLTSTEPLALRLLK
jgi:hypothetical protein